MTQENIFHRINKIYNFQPRMQKQIQPSFQKQIQPIAEVGTLQERRRDTYERILLAKDIAEKNNLVEQELDDSHRHISCWYNLANGETIDQWGARDRKWLIEQRYGRHELKDIDLLLKYEQADTEAKRWKAIEAIQDRLNLDPENKSLWASYSKGSNNYRSKNIEEDDQESSGSGAENVQKDGERGEESCLKKNFSQIDHKKEFMDSIRGITIRIMKLDNQDKSFRKEQKRQGHYRALLDMPMYLIHEIDWKAISSGACHDFAIHLAHKNSLAGLSSNSFFARVKKYIEFSIKKNEYYKIDTQFCKSMTEEQLSIFKSCDDSNVITALFRKKHSQRMTQDYIDQLTNEEKYQNCLYLYNQASDQPKSFQMSLLHIALAWGPKANIYNFELFKKYIEFIDKDLGGGGVLANITTGLKHKFFDKHRVRNFQDSFQQLKAGAIDDDNMEDDYLTYYAFENGGDLSIFRKKNQVWPNPVRIDSIECRVQIYMSRDGLKGVKSKVITQDLWHQFTEQVHLAFRHENKDKFRPGELVELSVDIKNVDSVHVRVFEFNTETYYRKNLKPFDTTVDLDGLEAKINHKYEYNEPKNVMMKRKFSFPELNNRVGLFIVDFQGNGRSARAVIKKGSLSLIHRSTEAGHQAYIIDDDRKICKGNEKVGLWLNNKWYPAKPDSGAIFIPYSTSQQSLKVIMQNGDFAQLGEFTRKTESYSFKASFFINGEQMIMGNNAQIMISPVLKINDREASLTLLKKVNVSLTTFNYIDQIPVTKKWENLNLVDGQEMTLDFQVPPNLESIDVKLTAQVTNATTKSVQNFSAEKKFSHTKQDTQEIYLRQVKDKNYEIQILGVNGEPRPNQWVKLKFELTKFGKNHVEELKTDKQGKCYLGQLDGISKVQAISPIYRSWNLEGTLSDFWTYPKTMNLLAGDGFSLPVKEMWDAKKPNEIMRQQFTFIQNRQNEVVKDCFQKLMLIKNQSEIGHYNLIEAQNLEPGEYVFEIKGIHPVTIAIVVHSGKTWNNVDNFIQKQTCIQEIIQSQKFVKIKKSHIQNDGKRISLQLADFSKDARVHIFATKFFQPDYVPLYNLLSQNVTSSFNSSVFGFAKWSNMLMSNRTLGDEYRYVVERQEAERQLGNTLDRPQMVNKRLFKRKTEMDREILNAGDQFQMVQEDLMVQQIAPQMMMMQNIMPQMKMLDNSLEDYKIDYKRSNYYDEFNFGGFGGRNMNGSGQFTFSEVQNFLKTTPLHAYNLKPDENGIVDFKSNKLVNYSTCIVVAVDKGSAVQHIKNLGEDPTVPIPKRDLRLKKIFDQSKGLTQTRETSILLQGENDFIEDIMTAETQIIDDLKKVKQVFTELNLKSGVVHQPKWAKLDFIFRWSEMNKEAKEQNLSEYWSHDFNFFLKKKDPEFFDQSVRPILSSKMERSLVDFWLLDQHDKVLECEPYVAVSQRLNAFEMCLYIDSLMRLGKENQDQAKIKLAKSLANKIKEEEEAKTAKNHNQAHLNMVFDLVLNLNSTSGQGKPNKVKAFLDDSADEQDLREPGLARGDGESSLDCKSVYSFEDREQESLSMPAPPEQPRLPRGGGLFGAAPAGGVFGHAPPAPQQQRPGGLFGATQQQQVVGGLFGNSRLEANVAQSFPMVQQAQLLSQQIQPIHYAQNAAPLSQNISSFGNAAPNMPRVNVSLGGGTGLFGAAPQQPTGSLFGAAPQQPTTGLFGAQNIQQQEQSSLFGRSQPQIMAQQPQPLAQQIQPSHFAQNAAPLSQNIGAFGFSNVAPMSQNLNSLSNNQNQAIDKGHFMDADLNRNQDPFTNLRNDAFNKEQFEQMESTGEYMETHYYDSKLKGGLEVRQSMPLYNLFWAEYAQFLVDDSKSIFVTDKFTHMVGYQPIQQFLALCILDLPFVAKPQIHTFQLNESTGQTITAGSTAILYKKEIKEVEMKPKSDFIVTHRYRMEGQRDNQEKAVPEEFLINKTYTCEIIMTNVSAQKQNFNLLYQIPAGSMPIGKTRQMMCKPFTLDQYRTLRTEFNFYFPATGNLGHYPSSLSIDGKVSARGEYNVLKVVKRFKKLKLEEAKSFDDFLQIGNKSKILDYIQSENLYTAWWKDGFGLHKILYLCQEDKNFWTDLVQILRLRQQYDKDVWKFGFYHQNEQAIKEYIARFSDLKPKRYPFKSKLFTNDDELPGSQFSKMREYNPMINARAHKIGQAGRQQILNLTFRETYDSFLADKILKPKLSFEDKMIFIYYLQLQDRINEAIDLFDTLEPPEPDSIENPGDMATLLMHYDYLSAYFDFFTGSLDGYKRARRLVQKYDNHPVTHWKQMFLAIQDQLDEFDGEFDNEIEEEEDILDGSGSDASLKLQERKQANMKKSMRREPNISQIEVDEKGEVSIESVNIKEITLNYYIIDAEILFSRQPFLKDNTEQFSYVKPYFSVKQKMHDSEEAQNDGITKYIMTKVPLPTNLLNKNLVIEVTGEDQQHFRTFYSSSIKVSIQESFGELKVTSKEGGKALQSIYVKVFAQNKDGSEKFYKDGYTDICGLFEYAQTSGDKLNQVSKFAIYLESRELGSQIKEVKPPSESQRRTKTSMSDEGFQQQDLFSQLQARKYDRMENRHQMAQMKYSNMAQAPQPPRGYLNQDQIAQMENEIWEAAQQRMPEGDEDF